MSTDDPKVPGGDRIGSGSEDLSKGMDGGPISAQLNAAMREPVQQREDGLDHSAVQAALKQAARRSPARARQGPTSDRGLDHSGINAEIARLPAPTTKKE